MFPPPFGSEKSLDTSSSGLQVAAATAAEVGEDAYAVAAEIEVGAAAVDDKDGSEVAEIDGLPGGIALLGYDGGIVDLIQIMVVQNSSMDHHLASSGLLPTSAAEPPLSVHHSKLCK